MELWETGLIVIWMKNVVPRAPKCFAKTKPRANSTRQVTIKTMDLAAPFFILGIGLGLATIAFLVEIIIHYNHRFKFGNIFYNW